MSAGNRSHRVTLQSLQSGQDAIGQPVTTWVDTATLWADIRYLKGLSAIKAGADTAQASVSIRILKRAVDAGQRIKHGATIYAIDSVLPDAKGKEIDLVAKVVT